jgi:hypothetical protein
MRVKPLRLAFIVLAAYAVTFPVDSSAALPEFFKNGAKLGATEAIAYSSANANSLIKNLGAGQSEITCTGGSAAGETNGPTKIQRVVIKFTGCKNQLTASCHSRRGGAAEIITESLRTRKCS